MLFSKFDSSTEELQATFLNDLYNLILRAPHNIAFLREPNNKFDIVTAFASILLSSSNLQKEIIILMSQLLRGWSATKQNYDAIYQIISPLISACQSKEEIQAKCPIFINAVKILLLFAKSNCYVTDPLHSLVFYFAPEESMINLYIPNETQWPFLTVLSIVF